MAQPTKPGADSDQTRIFRMPPTDATAPDLMGAPTQSHPTLAIVKGPQTGVVFELGGQSCTLGRDPKSDVFLNDMTVSRQHARMTFAGASASIEDLGSLNGTWVDGAIVNHAELQDGSTIQIGTFRMVFHTNTVPAGE